MFTVKSCIATLAFVAVTFNGVSASADAQGSVIAARDANHEARSVNSDITRRALEARKAAAKSSKKSANPYAAGSTFLSTKAAKAAAAIRCSPASDVCVTKTSPPANADAVCVKARCTFRCRNGFAPSGTSCVAAANTCGGTTCPTVTGGYNTCSSTNTCQPGCQVGFTLYSSGGSYKCFATQTDATHCGASFQNCAASYNGVGTPRCNNGQCSLSCPPGTALTGASSASNPLQCY